jgi:energy-coupling factor transporter ATP-binding protein EcfA2
VVQSVVSKEELQANIVPDAFKSFSAAFHSVVSGRTTSIRNRYLAMKLRKVRKELNTLGHTSYSAFKWAHENWASFVKSPLTRHFGELVAIAVATGMLPADSCDITFQGMEVFVLTDRQRITSVYGLVDAIFNSTNYFLDSVILSMEEGNLSPFLYEKSNSAKLDEAYELVKTSVAKMKNGAFYDEGGVWCELMEAATIATNAYTAAVKVATPSSFQRKILNDRLCDLIKWRFEIASARRAGELTKQPLCTILHGKPGCGKSTLLSILQRIHFTRIGLEYDPSRIANMITGEAFHSQVNNRTLFLNYDDVSNRKLAFDPSFGLASVLQAVNNVQFVAIKADLESKGMVMPDLQGVYGTTNDREMDIDVISKHGDSMRRRIVMVDVVVRPEYRTPMGGFDSKKFAANPRYSQYRGAEVQDFQTFTINVGAHGCFAPYVHNGVQASGLDVSSFLSMWELLADEHDVAQNALMQAQKITFGPRDGDKPSSRPAPPIKEEDDEIFHDLPDLEPRQPLDDDSDSDDDESMADGVKVDLPLQPFLRPLDDPDVTPSPLVLPSVKEEELQASYVTKTAASVTAMVGGAYSLFNAYAPQTCEDLASVRNSFWHMQFGFIPSAAGIAQLVTGIDTDFGSEVSKSIRAAMREDKYQWWFWVPRWMWNTSFIKALTPNLLDAKLNAEKRACSTAVFWYTIMAPTLIAVGMFQCTGYWGLPLFLLAILCCYRGYVNACLVAAIKEAAYEQLTKRRDALAELGDEYRQAAYDKSKPWVAATREVLMSLPSLLFMGSLLVGGAVYLSGGQLPQFFKKELDATAPEPEQPPPAEIPPTPVTFESGEVVQGFMGLSDEAIRNKSKERNVWDQCVQRAAFGIKNPNQTTAQLLNLLEKNTSFFEYSSQGEWKNGCTMTWLCSNLFVVPKHFADKVTEQVTWRIYDKNCPSSIRKRRVSPSSFYPSQYGDISIGYVSGVEKANLLKYLDFSPGQLVGHRICRDPESKSLSIFDVTGSMVVNSARQSVTEWKGNVESRVGHCGGAYVTKAPNPSIVGFHYAALTEDATIHRACMFREHELRAFMTRIHNSASCMLMAAPPEELEIVVQGTKLVKVGDTSKLEEGVGVQSEWILNNTEIGQDLKDALAVTVECDPVKVPDYIPPSTIRAEDKLPVLPVPEVETAEESPSEEKEEELQASIPVGSSNSAAFFKTKARPTIIADDVKERYPDADYAGPKFGRSMWPKSAVYAMNSTPGLPPDHLEWAACDYLDGFKSLPKILSENVRPLTWEETLNGIDGSKFIGCLNFSTSMGSGFTGTKDHWTTVYLDSLSKTQKRVFDNKVWDEVHKSIERLKAGERPGWLFRGVPKDEPTHVTKEKVRIFMVGQIMCTLLVRKYYTPICSLLQLCTAISECAVGINAASPDWEEMVQHLERFKLAFDADHKKFDLSKASQISTASYKIMIELAAMGDYKGEDLFIMQMMSTEMLLPLVNYAGGIYLLDGSTPSGIPVTVIINSLDNSLMNRCAYKSLFPRAPVGEFRKYVSHVNFGDDLINSVSFWRSSFNFHSMQKYLGDYGIQITPGDKSAKGSRFMDLKKLVFLQRTSSQLPELPYRVGKLNEKSIVKPLVCTLGGLSQDEAASVNIDGALREFVYHGQEIFEDRQEWLSGIATKHGIAHQCSLLRIPYAELLSSLQDDHIERWKREHS